MNGQAKYRIRIILKLEVFKRKIIVLYVLRWEGWRKWKIEHEWDPWKTQTSVSRLFIAYHKISNFSELNQYTSKYNLICRVCRFIFSTHTTSLSTCSVLSVVGVRCVKMSTDKISNQREFFFLCWIMISNNTRQGVYKSHQNRLLFSFWFHRLLNSRSLLCQESAGNKYWRVKLDEDDEMKREEHCTILVITEQHWFLLF